MKLYLDDDSVARQLANMLRNAGHQVTLPADVGMSGASDPRHLAYAVRHDLMLLTRDLIDFRDLHDLVLACGGGHPGVLVVASEKDRRRRMKPHHIVIAIGKLVAAGVPLANELHVLNQWR